MASTLADALCRRAATVTDPAGRVQLFRSLLVTADPQEVAEAQAALVERAGLRDTDAQVALLTLQAALGVRLSPNGNGNGHGTVEPDATGDPNAPTADPHHRVPDYGRGRPLSLGERKALVRQHDRRFLERALRDPHPDVITLLLQNPRVTEPDVVRVCARRPGLPEVLARVFDNTRWAASPRVRRTLAMNPATPPEITGSLVPMLPPEDLRFIAQDERFALSVRRRCLEVLARLTPTPGDPSGELH